MDESTFNSSACAFEAVKGTPVDVTWNYVTANSVYYRLMDDAALEVLAAMRRIAERNVAEVECVVRSYFKERDSLEAVSRDELLE